MTDANPLPFEREREITKAKELKLSGKKSRFQKQILERQEAEKAKETFDQRASQFMENRQQQQAEGVETAKKLIAMLRDKTIPQNKGVLSVTEEQEVRSDRMNALEYELSVAKKKIESRAAASEASKNG